MARIMGIDYGTKRTGLSVTDPLQIIVTGLDTVTTKDLIDYITAYCQKEEVEKFVIGEPQHTDGTPTKLHVPIKAFVKKLNKLFPAKAVVLHDEQFSSVRAKEVILKSGTKQKKRRDKALVDKVSAVLILQDYLGHLV